MMWQRFREEVENRNGKVHTGNQVVGLECDGSRITSLTTVRGGERIRIRAEQVISSMPLADLVLAVDPLPPDEVVQAAAGLRYRSLIVVALIAERAKQFPDQWVYIQSADVKVGRIQNFGNWSSAMVPTTGMTSLGMEYFCSEGDDLWLMPDADLIALAKRELVELGLARAPDIKDGSVVRQPKAYPVYDQAYHANLATIRRYMGSLENLQPVGRNGMHRYNNMDHSMLTGILAVRNLLGEDHNLWAVNVEQTYHEGPDTR
jgi:protoporphyrinogen oxidase